MTCSSCRGTGRVGWFLWSRDCNICNGAGRIETRTFSVPRAESVCEPVHIRDINYGSGGDPLTAAIVVGVAGGDPLMAAAASMATGNPMVGVAMGMLLGNDDERESENSVEVDPADDQGQESGDTDSDYDSSGADYDSDFDD